MKRLCHLLPALLLFVSACQKSSISPPVPTDPTDTSTLKKSAVLYNFDASGGVITDSVTYSWTYNNDRTVSLYTVTGATSRDTSRYSYGAASDVINTVSWVNGVLDNTQSVTAFHQQPGVDDSLVQQYVSLSAPSSSNKSVTYFSYNSFGQDTLERIFLLDSVQAPTAALVIRRFYSGAVPDSVYLTDLRSHTSSRQYYVSGDLYVTNVFDATGQQTQSETYGYLTTLSGNYYDGGRPSHLIANYTFKDFSGNNSFITTYQYAGDAAGRVAAVNKTSDQIYTRQLEVYTYY